VRPRSTRGSTASGHRARIVLAFFAIYVVWGSTYLAIRVAVETVPPLLAAGVRFAIAGTVLFVWARMHGAVGPSRRQWRSLTLLGALMFLLTYSGLFWAEKSVPSGIASVLVATVPLWTALLEMFVFKREPPRWTTLGAVLFGLAGVATLALDPRGGRVNLLACLVVVASQIAWSLGTALTTTMTLPKSHLITSGGQMMAGGAMLLASSVALGEVPPLPRISLVAAGAIAYQVVAGSLIAFTAYEWLLTQVPATKVTSYAYVNPVVALVIGHELGREPIGARTIVGCVLVLASTIAILRRRDASP
jgi:drug/metabolite transporter (DMT)-like permease